MYGRGYTGSSYQEVLGNTNFEKFYNTSLYDCLQYNVRKWIVSKNDMVHLLYNKSDQDKL